MRLAIAVALGLLTTAAFAPAPAAAAETPRLKIGMEINAVSTLKAQGANPDYAMFWLGAWNGDNPYNSASNWLKQSRDNGVTPVIQWWYWGDSISPSCVQYGCDGKSQSEWNTAADNMIRAIKDHMGGREVLVVIEPEFNKGGIATWETWDGLWVDHAKKFHAVPGVKVVLSFGNWGKSEWGNFDRAAAEADLLGFQMMRGSTQSSLSSYTGTGDAILASTKEMQTRFGRPSILTDLALSTYPEPEYLGYQEQEIKEIFSRAEEYYAAGLRGIVYRSLKDSPGMSLDNHFGEAERHWGMMWASNSTPKPSFKHWLAYAQGGTVSAPTPTTTTTTTASFAAPGAIEGEAMTTTTGGRSTDASASGGYAWNLWANGDAKATAKSTGGAYELVVRARGSVAAGVNAKMDVLVDGARKATYDMTTAYADYVVPVDVAAGDHAVVVRFTNDFKDASGDRNLYVDKVTVRAPAAPPPPPSPGAAELAAPLTAKDATAGAPFDVAYAVKNVGGSSMTATFGVVAAGAFHGARDLTLAVGETKTVTVALTLPAGDHVVEARMGAGGATAVPGAGGSATVHVKTPASVRMASALSAPAEVEAGKAFTATFAVKNDGEAAHTGTFAIAVDGAPQGAKSYTVAGGATATVSVSLTVAEGAHALEARMGDAAVPGDGATATVTAKASPFTATFTPKPGNEYWVEVKVSASQPLAGVSASVNGDAGHALALKSWGSWAGSFKVPTGSKVVFTATATDGAKATSGAYKWPDATPYAEPAPAPAPEPTPTPTPTPTSFSWKKEAESTAKKSTGGSAKDGAASGGYAWNLWANGYVADTFSAPTAGSYEIGATVRGTSVGGVQAAFDLVVDGKVIGSWSAATGYRTHDRTVALGAGTHEVRVVFKNDLKSGSEDRNLYVDYLTAKLV